MVGGRLVASQLLALQGEDRLLAGHGLLAEDRPLVVGRPLADDRPLAAHRPLAAGGPLAAHRPQAAGGPGVGVPQVTGRRGKEVERELKVSSKEEDEEWLSKYEKVPGVKEEEEEVIEIFSEDSNAKMKLTTTLKDHVKYWEEMGASAFSLSVIKEGYKMTFEGLEGDLEYEERNNKSYYKHQEFANKAVDELVKVGVVEKVEGCKCVNPLTVAENKKGKKRLCLDLSRKVNKFAKAPKFKIRSLKEVANLVEKDDYGFSFDLRSFYHQIPIHKDFRGYLGLAVEREDGSKEYYVFRQLPFGLNDAARCVTKLLRGPLEMWRSWGARTAEIHIDDGIIFAKGKAFALQLSRKVRQDLQCRGLLISEDKCSWGARRKLEWVGFVWDTKEFKLFITEEKVARVVKVVEELLEKKCRAVPIKEVASFCGLMTSLRPALGDIARLRTRSMLQMVAEAEQRYGWGATVVLDSRSVQELLFWKDNVAMLSGYAIRMKPGVVSIRQRWFVSDAGEYLAGGVEWSKAGRKEGTEYQVHLTDQQQQGSSTERELVGMREGLKLFLEELEGSELRWTCDNKAVSVICRVGSMRPRLQDLAMDIWDMTKQYNIKLEMDWQPRDTEVVRFADQMSKDMDFSDFYICKEDFSVLQSEFGPFAGDYFASSFTCRMVPFFSRFMCEGSSGVDAFSVSWREGRGYFHPPVHRIVDTVRYAREQRAEGIMVVPYWDGSAFWAFLRDEVGVRMRKRFRPFLVAPKYFRNRTFSGRPKFDFAVFEFDF